MSKIGGVAEVDSLEIANDGRIAWAGREKAVLYPSHYGTLLTPAYSIAVNEQAIPMVGRTRITVGQMNAGYTLLAAVPNLGYRIFDLSVIAIGANAAATAAATGIAIYGTATTEVAIYTALLAALTRSAVNQLGTADTSVLADGASFTRMDYNTAITTKAVSAAAFDLITVTHFDINLQYTLER